MTIAGADHVVAMGEWAASDRPGDVLTCVGIGSCIALLLLDRGQAVAGMGHVVVPGRGDGPAVQYADTAVPELVRQTVSLGAELSDLGAVLVGGAAMFDFGSGEPIGARNEQAVRAGLRRAEIPVVGSDTGGRKGRTVRATIGGGGVEVRVRTSGLGETRLDLDPVHFHPGAGPLTAAPNLERVKAPEVIG